MSLTDTVFNAGIVGCGGAGFPTHVKYNAKVEHFIVNAAEKGIGINLDVHIVGEKNIRSSENTASIYDGISFKHGVS